MKKAQILSIAALALLLSAFCFTADKNKRPVKSFICHTDGTITVQSRIKAAQDNALDISEECTPIYELNASGQVVVYYEKADGSRVSQDDFKTEIHRPLN